MTTLKSCSPRWTIYLLPLALLLCAGGLWAEQIDAGGVDWGGVLLHLFGGLALFLAGLDMLSEGLKKVAGESLKVGLQKLTRNRFMAAATGAFVTAVINSSSVTTVLVVGFVTAGVMTLAQSVGVIMGANIGSTMTAQLLAFNLSELALLGIAVGFFMHFTGRNEQVRQYGAMVMGLGLIFYGMGVMSDGMRPLRAYEPFLDMLRSMEKPLLGIVAGAAFTALVQSSAATVGIAIAMASEGLLTLPTGISLALGANIGTCATALLAAIGKPVAAVRTAWIHVLFNVAGVLIWLPFIDQLAAMAVTISPSATELQGAERMAADVPRQIANANTLFNVANTLLFIGFTGVFATLAQRLIPDRPERKDVVIEPLYLDPSAQKVPALALERVREELSRTGDITLKMMETVRHGTQEGAPTAVAEQVSLMHARVTVLRSSMLAYLSHTGEKALIERDAQAHRALMTAIMDLGNIADLVAGSLFDLAERATVLGADKTEKTQEIFGQLYETVHESVTLAVQAVAQSDAALANRVNLLKHKVRELSDAFIQHKWSRLRDEQDGYAEVVEVQVALMDRLRQIYTLAKRMTKTMLPESQPETQ